MCSRLNLAGIVLISASEDAIWTLIADYSMSNIYDMHSFFLVSKSFCKLFQSRRGRFSKLVGRSFKSLLEIFFAPMCNSGIGVLTLLDSFFKLLDKFQYDDMSYCISGGFALAVLVGADLSSPEWCGVDLDIYFTSRDYSKFRKALSLWADNNGIREYCCKYLHPNYDFEKMWGPKDISVDYFLYELVEFTATKSNRRIKFHFVRSELMTPKQFCEQMFPLTFLMNTLVVKDNWRVPETSIKYLHDILERIGRYSSHFRAYWERQWNRWHDKRPYCSPLQTKSAQMGKRKAKRMIHFRWKYESRGFCVHGPVPQTKYSLFDSPFQECQKSPKAFSTEKLTSTSPRHSLGGNSVPTIDCCEVTDCSKRAILYCAHVKMYLCYEHRVFTKQDKRRMLLVQPSHN